MVLCVAIASGQPSLFTSAMPTKCAGFVLGLLCQLGLVLRLGSVYIDCLVVVLVCVMSRHLVNELINVLKTD